MPTQEHYQDYATQLIQALRDPANTNQCQHMRGKEGVCMNPNRRTPITSLLANAIANDMDLTTLLSTPTDNGVSPLKYARALDAYVNKRIVTNKETFFLVGSDCYDLLPPVNAEGQVMSATGDAMRARICFEEPAVFEQFLEQHCLSVMLFHAIARNDQKTAIELLNTHSDKMNLAQNMYVSGHYVGPQNALTYAVETKQIDTISALLKAGASFKYTLDTHSTIPCTLSENEKKNMAERAHDLFERILSINDSMLTKTAMVFYAKLGEEERQYVFSLSTSRILFKEQPTPSNVVSPAFNQAKSVLNRFLSERMTKNSLKQHSKHTERKEESKKAVYPSQNNKNRRPRSFSH